MTVLAFDAITFHRFGLQGREPLLLMLMSSLATFAVTRLYTRLARARFGAAVTWARCTSITWSRAAC